MSAERLLNIDVTLERLAGDASLLTAVAKVFTRTVPPLLNAIDVALAGPDLDRVRADAHALKGAVGVFEAPDVLKSVAELERHAENYDATSAAQAFAAAHALVARLMVELRPLAQPT